LSSKTRSGSQLLFDKQDLAQALLARSSGESASFDAKDIRAPSVIHRELGPLVEGVKIQRDYLGGFAQAVVRDTKSWAERNSIVKSYTGHYQLPPEAIEINPMEHYTIERNYASDHSFAKRVMVPAYQEVRA